MRTLWSALDTYILNQLGRCSRCMRTAFIAAAAGIVVAAVATALSPVLIAAISWLVAAMLTALWLAHVWMFTSRSVRATAIRDGGGSITAQQADLWPRRRVLAAFIRVLIFSALARFIPRNARAEDCNCYSDQDCSCPPDFPNCVFNPTTGEAICCGPNSPGCAGPTQTWCCPPGSNCYGTEGQCYSGE